jgi:hypothetical protein
MEKLTKKQVEDWIGEQNWLLVSKNPTYNGNQFTYLTPSGQDVVVAYDLENKLFGIGHIVQVPNTMQKSGLPSFHKLGIENAQSR